jgi:ABC-type glutathione transport system ATPase component
MMQTHNVALTRTVADFVVVLLDGRVAQQGSSDSVLQNTGLVEQAIEEDQKDLPEDAIPSIPVAEGPSKTKKPNGILIEKEEIIVGRAFWKSRS